MTDTVRAVLLFAAAAVVVVAGCARSVDGSPETGAVAGPATTSATTPAVTTAPKTTTTSAPPSTTTTTTTSTPPPADPQAFAGTAAGSYYFTTPSTKFHCAILTGGDLPTAGCHGPMPASAPKVPGAGASGTPVTPNAIEVTGGRPGQFASAGDPRFYPLDGSAAPALSYGRVLQVNDLTCVVDEAAGVSCRSEAGHGFTLSDSAFRVW
ncbi:hypothetical protein JWS13_36175 [Rhodococcus pseudokoreensis]|uniref:Uncharacterized protein n=1 Tax=Rhodococcus pseudokoreensis TaxID=2811421 RepID=A0A974WBC4_9NOCA|nr:hypothetical protein [Rhodococcus pseudokoreensis]QSE93648.1 hypothetical protein JWS13_36175 [Rhodococcus pseudokoreensis]